MDGCALISTNAGWNLAIGAFPRATGRFETLHASDGCRDVTGQVQQDRCWFEYGVQQIREAPRHWLSLIPAKLGYTFDHESFAVEYLHEARPASWPEARREAARGVTTAAHRFLVVAAAFGLCAVAWRRWGSIVQGALLVLVGTLVVPRVHRHPDVLAAGPARVDRPVAPPARGRSLAGRAKAAPVALLGTTVITVAVFFGEDRYHLVATPVLCMLAAACWRRARGEGAVSSQAGRPSGDASSGG